MEVPLYGRSNGARAVLVAIALGVDGWCLRPVRSKGRESSAGEVLDRGVSRSEGKLNMRGPFFIVATAVIGLAQAEPAVESTLPLSLKRAVEIALASDG